MVATPSPAPTKNRFDAKWEAGIHKMLVDSAGGQKAYDKQEAARLRGKARVEKELTLSQRATIYREVVDAGDRAQKEADRACPEPELNRATSDIYADLNKKWMDCVVEKSDALEEKYTQRILRKYKLSKTEWDSIFDEQFNLSHPRK